MLDPVENNTWEIICKRAANNTAVYRRLFGCYPDDEMKKRVDITKKRKES
jgi:hypothetical protein